MARDGSGTFTRDGTTPSAGQTISSTQYNADIVGIASALTASIAKDGQTTPTANLPMGSYKHTGVATTSGGSRSEYVSGAVEQDGGTHWCGTAGGTADALTLTPSPAITSYTAGQVFRFKAGSSANTGAATLAVSGLTAKDIQKAGAALAASDIAANKWFEVIYDGAAFQLQAYTVNTGVTSVAAGNGMNFSTITTTGTVAAYNASSSQVGVVELATAAETKAAASSSVVPTVDVLLAHPGVAKVWAKVTYSGGVPSLAASHNVASITDNGVGDFTLTFTTAFASAHYAVSIDYEDDSVGTAFNHAFVKNGGQAAGTLRISVFDNGGSATDAVPAIYVVCHGHQI